MLRVLYIGLLVNVVCVIAQTDDLTSLVQCITNDECDEVLACIDLKCQNPCPGICNGNTNCEVHNHVPFCACKPGFSGNPFNGCQEQQSCHNNVEPSPCPALESVATPTTCKKEYLVVSEDVKWNEAVRECNKKGQNLVTIDTLQEWQELKRVMIISGPPAHYWIGGTNLNNNTWMWISTWTPIHFTNWDVGEPNNQHCIYIKKDNMMWDDWDCYDGVSHYICEKCVA